MINLLYTGVFVAFFMAGIPDTPPGTIHLKENVYVDQSEISNLDWKEYVAWIKKAYGENSSEYDKALPDWDLWKSLYKTEFSTSWISSDINQYPVVGISYAQATAYCKWRTSVVNEKFKGQYTVRYRLPDETEFQEVMLLEKEQTKKYYDDALGLYRSPDRTKGHYTLFVSNNVSEMTEMEGIAFGGNYHDQANSLKPYTSPQSWLGFRCVAEVSNLHHPLKD